MAWLHVFVSTLANSVVVFYLFDDNENKTVWQVAILNSQATAMFKN